MNLRKRRSTEKEIENFRHTTDDVENTASSFLTEEERALNENVWNRKRVKLEETESVLNKKIKSEDDKDDFNDYEEDESDWEDLDKRVNMNKVSK